MQIFYEKVLEFQLQYAEKLKYTDSFARHIPYGSIAPGNYLLELPNFSENLKKVYQDYLVWAKKFLKQAVEVGKQEAVFYEFELGLVEALRTLSEVCFLISEYRQRVLGYKYAKYAEQDKRRKVDRKRE